MTTELTKTTADNINQAHADCMACDDDLRDAVLRKVNAARQCGIFLLAAKDSTPHGQWLHWVRDNLRFGDDTALAYMRFARANPEPIRDLKDGISTMTEAMIASGALSAPHRDGKQQRSTVTMLDKWTSGVELIRGLFSSATEKIGPVSQWPTDERAAMKAQLEPLVRVYEQL